MIFKHVSQPVSKWVFQVDADTIIANLSKPINQYLDTPAEVFIQLLIINQSFFLKKKKNLFYWLFLQHKVVLHFRRNLEVTAAMVGFRAASPFARFIKKKKERK